LPSLSWLEPITGETIRSSGATAERYERDRPGELVTERIHTGIGATPIS